jgi:hypothetical protein
MFVDGQDISGFNLLWSYFLWGGGGILFFIVVVGTFNCMILLKDQESRSNLSSAIRGIGEIFRISRTKIYVSITLSTATMFLLGALFFRDNYVWFWVAKKIVGLI